MINNQDLVFLVTTKKVMYNRTIDLTESREFLLKKALIYGVGASFFFAFTFILNRSMNLQGGSWVWSACLRYLFMLPMLYVVVKKNGRVEKVISAIREAPGDWILWSVVGFGLFYAPLSLASVYGASWFSAASWQLTIVCGVLLTPLFGHPIPFKHLIMSLVILVGVGLLQVQNVDGAMDGGIWKALIPVLIAAFSYPLGNRKMMVIASNDMMTLERVFGMTLCSMVFWLPLSCYAWWSVGVPSGGQLAQSFAVALFSGVVATLLFFIATDVVRENPKKLAIIEATQSGEVLFTLLGGVLFLGDALPDTVGVIGIGLILVGMVGNSLLSST